MLRRRRKARTGAQLSQSRRHRQLAWHRASTAASPPPPPLQYRRARCNSATSNLSAILLLKRPRSRPPRSSGHTRPALRRPRRRARCLLRCRRHRLRQRTHIPGHLPHNSKRTRSTRTTCPCRAVRLDTHPAFPAAGAMCRLHHLLQPQAQCIRRCHRHALRPSRHRYLPGDGRRS